jgi:hypothetical protein
MITRFIAALGFVVLVGLGRAGGAMAQEKAPSYVLRGEEAEGCECESVCPCVWAKDDTFGDCRAVMVWHVDSGTYGSTDLKGSLFAVALTKSGKNVVQSMGKWEGTIYVGDRATEAQKNAIVAILSGKWGKAFAKVDVKSAPMTFKSEGDKREASIGKGISLKIAGIPGSNGKVPSIENPPFALIPKLYCAKAETHTFDDGAAKWDFSGRNAFYGPFEYKSE